MARLITLKVIQAEKVSRSRSWLLSEMQAGRFPRPAVAGNPNLWDADAVDRWVAAMIERARLSPTPETPRPAAPRRKHSAQ